jgi:hypothetical protein
MLRPVAQSQQDTEVSKALLLALFLDPSYFQFAGPGVQNFK